MRSRIERSRAGAPRGWLERASLTARCSVLALSSAGALSGCVIQEVIVAEPEEVLVAEAMIQLRDDGTASRPRVFALLHHTLGLDTSSVGVPGAKVTITRPDGLVVTLTERTRFTDCAVDAPEVYGVTCYRAVNADENRFQPGESLTLQIETADGKRLEGVTKVPSAFTLKNQPPLRFCVLSIDSALELVWTPSEGAWGYVAETLIENFRAGLAEKGIEVEQNRIHLVGLSISKTDTTIVFPTEFGLIERFTEDVPLLVSIQKGLPKGTNAQISISAVERNYTNWNRGGTFNPSGQVRVPSLRGDGTGVFGAAIVRTLNVWTPPRPDRQNANDPSCPVV
jgi:hypothetical protein